MGGKKGGKRGGGHEGGKGGRGGGGGGGGGGGYHAEKKDRATREREDKERVWAKERDWDRQTFPRRHDEVDIWDSQPTFKSLPELEDRRTQEELEEILTAAENKLASLRAQLDDASKQKEEQEALKRELEGRMARLNAEKDGKLGEAAQLQSQLEASASVTTQIAEKIRALKEEKQELKKKKFDKLKENKITSRNIQTDAELRKKVRSVEEEMEGCRRLSPAKEREFMMRIKKFESERYVIRDVERLETKMKEKDEEVKLCERETKELEEGRRGLQDKVRQLQDASTGLTKKVQATQREIQQSANQDIAAIERRQQDFVDLMTHKVGYRAAKSNFEKALDAWVANKDAHMNRRREEEKILAQREEKWKGQQDRREAALAKRRENPWVAEKAACEELLKYLQNLAPKAAARSSDAAAPAATEAPAASEEAAAEAAPEAAAAAATEAEKGEKAEEGAKGGEKKAAKDGVCVFLSLSLSHHPHVSRTQEEKKEEVDSSKKLKHDLQRLKDFDVLKLPIPSTEKKAAAVRMSIVAQRGARTHAHTRKPFPQWTS